MNLDYGRQKDLEDLMEERNNTSSKERRKVLESVINKIMRESDKVRYLRSDMLKAFRANDKKAVERIRLHLQSVRMDETHGVSWGNEKSERKFNGLN